MKQFLVMIMVLFTLLQANAQPKNFKKTIQEINRLLFYPDTVLFDDETIKLARFYKNGNVELASGNSDTTRFNLHLLHKIYLDDDSTYNRYGLHISESSVQLFLDPVMQEIDFNENDELISKGSMLAFYSLTLRSPAEARLLAEALIHLRMLTKMDDKIFDRRN